MKELSKHLRSKKGFTAMEFVIACSVLVIFTIGITFGVFPEQTKKITDQTFGKIVSLWNFEKNAGSSLGQVVVEYPTNSDKWTDASHFETAMVSGNFTITGLKSTFTGTTITVPREIGGQTVQVIGRSAFSNKNLKEVHLPPDLIRIDDYAFSNNKIERILLSEGLLSVGNGAFKNNNIGYLIVPSSLSSIGTEAFQGNRISKLSIPETLTVIGDYAFKDNLLSKIEIPLNVVAIGTDAFRKNALSSITIGGNVELIKDGAFKEQASSNAVVRIEGVNKDRFDSSWGRVFDSHFRVIK